MGLDMFLYRMDENGENEIFYWRKAYPIMDFFETKIFCLSNCRYYTIKKEVFEELLDFCNRYINYGYSSVRDEYGDMWVEGCDDDDWMDYYLHWVESTKDFLEEFLETADFDKYEYTFYAWW